MNKLIRKIAKEAGFIFWQNESWKPEDAIIDWSSVYDKELVKYTEILLNNLASIVDDKAAEAIRNYYNNQDIVADEPTKETVDIELSEADLFALMKMAHKMNITFNQLCEEVLQEYIAQGNER